MRQEVDGACSFQAAFTSCPQSATPLMIAESLLSEAAVLALAVVQAGSRLARRPGIMAMEFARALRRYPLAVQAAAKRRVGG